MTQALTGNGVKNGVEGVMNWIQLLPVADRKRLLKHGDELSVCVLIKIFLTDFSPAIG
jgi:hypothetical protein